MIDRTHHEKSPLGACSQCNRIVESLGYSNGYFWFKCECGHTWQEDSVNIIAAWLGAYDEF